MPIFICLTSQSLVSRLAAIIILVMISAALVLETVRLVSEMVKPKVVTLVFLWFTLEPEALSKVFKVADRFVMLHMTV